MPNIERIDHALTSDADPRVRCEVCGTVMDWPTCERSDEQGDDVVTINIGRVGPCQHCPESASRALEEIAAQGIFHWDDAKVLMRQRGAVEAMLGFHGRCAKETSDADQK